MYVSMNTIKSMTTMWNISVYRLGFCLLILLYVEVTENNNMSFLYNSENNQVCGSGTRDFVIRTIVNGCGTTYKQPVHSIIIQTFQPCKLQLLPYQCCFWLLAKFIVLKLEIEITTLDVSNFLGSGLLYNNLFRPI